MKQKETIILEMDIKISNKNFNFEYKTQAEVKFYPQ